MFKTLLIKESWLLFGVISFLYFLATLKTENPNVHLVYLGVIITLWIFYRAKDEEISLDENSLLSPCGGTVKEIKVNEYGVTKIRVFLNIHNQHAQFYPVSGTITNIEYKHGEFYPAYFLEKTQYNEHTTTSIETKNGDTVKVTQIAGQVARRIVNHAVQGSRVSQGEYFGMIKFSSAVDIEFSNDWKTRVQVGDKLTPLKTIIASR